MIQSAEKCTDFTSTFFFNGHNYSQVIVGLARGNFWPKSFTNRLARPDVRRSTTIRAGIWNLFGVLAIARILFAKDTDCSFMHLQTKMLSLNENTSLKYTTQNY